MIDSTISFFNIRVVSINTIYIARYLKFFANNAVTTSNL